MLSNSFIFLPRVTLGAEQKLWQKDILSWSKFLSTKKVDGFGKKRKLLCDWKINHARLRLKNEDFSFFSDCLPKSEVWRLFDILEGDACYLDIETDGYYGSVTVVGISDGFHTKTLVMGFNLDKHNLQQALSKFKLIVTFNGSSFDLPILKKYFNLDFNLPHVDLRHVCKRIGLSGGLKKIEQELGICRRNEVSDMAGDDAVYLWQMWCSTRNKKYLQKLVWYNEEDVINLRPLAKFAIPRLWNKIRSSQKI